MNHTICHFSDTHTLHNKIPNLLGAKIAIHTGDISSRGYKAEIKNFLEWYSKQSQFEYKILISGNHDFFFEKASKDEIDELLAEYPNIIYLNDSGVEIEGINIWGSPVQPWFWDWAFNRQRGEDIKKHWDLIPLNTDILAVHGPPRDYLDWVLRNLEKVGCEDLRKTIWNNPNIKAVLFGHIHEAYGHIQDGDKHFFNSSILNAQYEIKNSPQYFTFNIETKQVELL